MAVNSTFVGVRCPDEVVNLVDQVGSLYGLTRAEIMRNGAINYCQQLLVTDTLQQLNQVARKVAAKADKCKIDTRSLQEMENLVSLLYKRLGMSGGDDVKE